MFFYKDLKLSVALFNTTEDSYRNKAI